MNEQNFLSIKAAIYNFFGIVRREDFAPDKFKSQLKKCARFGLNFDYLDKWNKNKQDSDNIVKLYNILSNDIKNKNHSDKYHDFFANANEFFQELKPYADAYYEAKTKGLEVKSLGNYIYPNHNQPPKPAAAKNRAKPKPENLTVPTMKNAVIKFNDFSDFSKDATELNIYIDEAWPCNDDFSDNSENKKIGVIAGIVWLGKEINTEVLPHIATHLRQETKKAEYKMLSGAEKIRKFLLPPMQDLFNCQNAMPFIFPLKSETEMNSSKEYFTIFEAAVKILLGWILPQNGQKCNVRIYPEHFSEEFAGIGHKTNKTEYFQGVLNEAMKSGGRFERFNLKKVEWQDKDFGYIPYGDLLGYMTLSNPKSLEFRERSKCEQLAGYLPVSLNLFDVLLRLDIIEETKNVEDIFGLIDEIYGTKIYRFIMKDLKQRLNENKELKQKLLYSLEARYLDKDRDMGKLRKYFTEIMPLIESEEEDAKTVTKLLFTSIRLQDANHEGNPEKIRAYLEDYDEKRKRALELGEFESVADCELNIAVHYNDEFLFDKAFETISRNKSYFNSFRLPTRCKFYSSLGQSMSINKQFDKADKCFCQAVDSFEKSEEQNKLKEIDQTTVYRMFNLLEWKNPEYPQKFKEFFGKPADAAVKFAKENSTADQYRHHLFIRSVFECSELTEYKQAYLAESKNWEYWPQHPWQLIEFYRAMLSDDEAESYKHLENALEICGFEAHGGIIALMGAVLAAAGIAKYPSKKEELKRKSLEFIEKAGSVAGAGKILGDLRQRLEKGCDFASVLEFLPFNYR